jgi:nucleoside-triphosphatase THEP1
MQLPSPARRGEIILLSGWRGVGKTTLLLALREDAIQAGLTVGGFLSVPRIADGTKTGIDLMDAATGETVPLATYRGDTSGEQDVPKTKHYVFDPAALDAGRQSAEAGYAADVFFVDELGPLELRRGEGWADVISMVRVRAYGVAFVVVRPELVDLAREALELPPESPLVAVNEANRAARRVALGAWLGRFTPAAS